MASENASYALRNSRSLIFPFIIYDGVSRLFLPRKHKNGNRSSTALIPKRFLADPRRTGKTRNRYFLNVWGELRRSTHAYVPRKKGNPDQPSSATLGAWNTRCCFSWVSRSC